MLTSGLMDRAHAPIIISDKQPKHTLIKNFIICCRQSDCETAMIMSVNVLTIIVCLQFNIILQEDWSCNFSFQVQLLRIREIGHIRALKDIMILLLQLQAFSQTLPPVS